MCLQSLPGACPSTGLPQVHSLISGLHLLWLGLCHRLQVDLCSPVVLYGLQGDSCLTMVVTMGYRHCHHWLWHLEHFLPLLTWNTSSLCSPWCPAVLFLSCIFTLHFSGCNYICSTTFLSSQIPHHRSVTLIPDWLSLSQQHTHLGATWH